MIEDLSARAGGAIEADLCVIGGGAAGVTIARELAGTGVRVCLLESGGLAPEADTQALYEGPSVGHPMTLHEGRYRILGGSTTQWTGRCIALDPVDFEQRPWLALSGWPIGLHDLEPYYRRAQSVCGFAEPWISDEDAVRSIDVELPAFNGALIRPLIGRFAVQRGGGLLDWGAAYRSTIEGAANVTALLHANVTEIRADETGRVTSATARSLSGASVTVTARAFVLACGGIENARLLLANPIGAPGGPANRFDQVGRYFMQHPRGRIATIDTRKDGGRRLQRTFNNFRRLSGLQYEVGVALSETAQRREHLLNCTGFLRYEANPDSPWESAKDALKGLRKGRLTKQTVVGLGRALAGAGDVAANLGRRLGNQVALIDAQTAHVMIDLEQEPDPQSRVTLDSATDALGMPRARIDWRIGERERATARYLAHQIAVEFERLGFGQVMPDPWLTSDAPISLADLEGNYHHIGTTRMSADPRTGVVDADCRVHGTDNLYAMGCSSFGTGGHANPTYTIVAMSLRLADRLRGVLAERPAAKLRSASA